MPSEAGSGAGKVGKSEKDEDLGEGGPGGEGQGSATGNVVAVRAKL